MYNSLRVVHDLLEDGIILDKPVIMDNLDNLFNSITENTIPMLKSIVDNRDSFAHLDNNVYIHNAMQGVFRGGNLVTAIDNVLKLVTDFVNAIPTLKALVDTVGLENTTQKTLTAKYATVLRICNDMGALSMYIMDLLSTGFTMDLSGITPDKANRINSGIIALDNIYSAYNNSFNRIVDDINGVAVTNIHELAAGPESIVDATLRNNGNIITLPTDACFQNPSTPNLYRFYIWETPDDLRSRIEWSDKIKKVSDYKLMSLKLLLDNSQDSNLDEQIHILESSIAELEYEINTEPEA